MTLFHGKPYEYWFELQEKLLAGDPSREALIFEIANLRARISFYESRINAMHEFMASMKTFQ